MPTENPFRCDRLIKYDGKTLPCDSHLRRDGENLRAILSDTPDAVSALDRYQRNRRKIRFAAYTGTLGFATTVFSSSISSLFTKNDASNSKDFDRTQKIVRYSGLGVLFGSIFYGLGVLKANESNLDQAILKFNESHPDKPIEILFQTKF